MMGMEEDSEEVDEVGGGVDAEREEMMRRRREYSDVKGSEGKRQDVDKREEITKMIQK